MPRSAWTAGILMVLVLGCRTSGPPAEAKHGMVRALQYKRLAFESALEFSHGGGTWHEELYFPREGIRATMATASSWDEKDQEMKYRPKLYVSHGRIGNKFAVSFHDPEVEQPTREVEVPEDLANRIFLLAGLQKRVDQEQDILGRLTEDADLLHRDPESPLREK